MALDDANCHLFTAGSAAATTPSTSAPKCEFEWRGRMRRCPERTSLADLAGSCPGTHRFATADTPSLYAATRQLQWADLNETASVTWNEAVDADAPAPLGDVHSTAAAFVALSRCKTAIVAPMASQFSDTAAIAAGVPVVGCCSMLSRMGVRSKV